MQTTKRVIEPMESYQLQISVHTFLETLLDRKAKFLIEPNIQFKVGQSVKLIEEGNIFGIPTGRELWMIISKFEKAKVMKGEIQLYWLTLECK